MAELIEYDASIAQQVPPLLQKPDTDTRLPTQRDLERAYNAYALAHMRLRAVDDPSSNHAALSELERRALFDERLIELQAKEDAFRAEEKRCAAAAARRAKSNSQSRASDMAQRHLYAEAWPDDLKYIASRFPYRPRVSNAPDIEGTKRRPLHEARAWNYIQYDPAVYTHLLIIDYDAPGGIDVGEVWKQARVAKPNLICRTPNSPKGHIVYAIKAPVPLLKLDPKKAKALSYFHAVEVAYTKALKGDVRFNGQLTKNPVTAFGVWDVEWLNPTPYTLKELHSFVELPNNARRAKRELRDLSESHAEKIGKGRNCYMFYTVADWAYVAIREYWHGKASYDAWCKEVRAQCEALNEKFPAALGAGEVRMIATSIARWVWANTTPSGFSEKQAARGAKGGQRSGVTRLAKAQVRAEQAQALKEAGKSNKEIAEELGIHRNSVANLLRRDPLAG